MATAGGERVMGKWFRIGWIELSPEEAMDFGFEQAARVRWRVFIIELFGRGITIMAEPIL